MNDQLCKNGSVPLRVMAALIFAMFCHTETTNAAPVSNVECFLNWAQTFYATAFAPAVSGLEQSLPYTYRYYANTNSYLGVSSDDNHVYYLGPDATLPQDMGDLSAWLKQSGCGDMSYPVIFIHGLASSSYTWAPFRDYLINNAGWVFGGVPMYDPAARTVAINCPSESDQPATCSGGAGTFYTMNFSDNQNLTFDAQGGELSAIIAAVLAANPGKNKVVLISHSMGSLAAREYLQGLATQSNAASAIPYRNDVAKLITVGAPNQGSFWAGECYTHFDILSVTGNVGVCDLLPVQIDPNSVSLRDLQPGSSALKLLNDVTTHPLPSDVAYVSIVGTGQQTLTKLVDFEAGDGIVSDTSQDLASVASTLPQQQAVKVNVALRECGNKVDIPGIGNISETHTCETTDTGVGAQILGSLH
ncbi:MAG: esterase/lipase family protein [Methylobacter sp.]